MNDHRSNDPQPAHNADCTLDGSANQPYVSTVGIEAEMQTLENMLRAPRDEAYSEEPGCKLIVHRVELIGASQPQPDAKAPPEAAFTQLGPYQLEAKLGEGGMGAVYRALHTKLNKHVALKVLPADRLNHVQAVARFEREMQAVGRLNHPNIVAAHDAGEIDGHHYLVMELVDGINLSTLVRRCGRLPLAEACEIILRAAEGLHHAHALGMVHRDIKPGNLMLTRGAEVKILDMGLALLDEMRSAGEAELTATGQIMGTLDYMAPEQGTDSRSVDIRADIYSLGATLFKLLTGEAPFHGPKYDSPMAKMMALAVETPRALKEIRRDIPAELSQLVSAMLSKHPEQRPATPQLLAEQLAPFAAGAHLEELARSVFEPIGESSGDPSSDTFASLRSSTADTWPHLPAADSSPRRRAAWAWIAGAAFVLAAGIVVIIRDRNHAEVARIVLPEGGSAHVQEIPPAAVTSPAGNGFWKPDAQQQAFLDQVANQPPEEQVAAVAARLQQINPGFDGRTTHKIQNGKVTEFAVSTVHIAELWPVRAFPALEVLRCGATYNNRGKLRNLEQLAGMQLSTLILSESPVADLAPLRGMPLKRLVMNSTAVKDLSPLTGMALTELSLGTTAVGDLSPLAGMPLASLGLHYTYITDLTPLRNMPLTSLNLEGSRVSDLSPLAGLPLKFVLLTGSRVADLRPLASTPLERLECANTEIADLTPLARLPLESLNCSGTQVTDISPLKECPLQSLNCSKTRVSTLLPLAGMALKSLNISETDVWDLAPLQGMKLQTLTCDGAFIADFSPLRETGLKELYPSFRLFHHEDEKALRSLASLTKLGAVGDRTPEAFWTAVAAARQAADEFAGSLGQAPVSQQADIVAARIRELNQTQQIALETSMEENNIVAAVLSLPSSARNATPLRALPHLMRLTIHGGARSLDLSPLNNAPLEQLTCSEEIARFNAPVFRTMKALKTVNGKSAEEYFK